MPAGEEVWAGPVTARTERRLEAGQVRVRWSVIAPPGQPRLPGRSRHRARELDAARARGNQFHARRCEGRGRGECERLHALRADESFRLEAQPSDTLEQRRRTTPVHGDYALSLADRFALQVKVAKRPVKSLQRALTGYALPMEGVLDLHARIAWEFQHSGVCSVRIRVPEAVAVPISKDRKIAEERNLAGDVWTIKLPKRNTQLALRHGRDRADRHHPRDR